MPRSLAANLKVAIVHYWFLGVGGGERVVEALAQMFPQADLFCLLANGDAIPSGLKTHRITTSFLQRLPGSRRWYRHMLPLQPFALEQWDLSGYDLVLSSESGPAKGVLTRSDACHICYCHSPMRYLWDLYSEYRTTLPPLMRVPFSLMAHYLRMWDQASAMRVDHFVANSHNVASRIAKHYRRDSRVIYPPVPISDSFIAQPPDDFYLVVSRLVAYKRVDIAIQACNRLRRRLRIIGNGEQYKYLRRVAGPTIEFLGCVDDATLRQNYAHCRALLFPGEEDFGLVPVEAQSFGRPVIAYGRGGALESIVGLASDRSNPETSTGIFVLEQSCEAMMKGILKFEELENSFSSTFIRANAERFSPSRFRTEMADCIDACVVNAANPRPPTPAALLRPFA